MQTNETKQIRGMVSVFIIFLVLSGVTAFPLTTEVHFMMEHLNAFPVFFHPWIKTVYESVTTASPVVLYGTDWLAFAHMIISLFFIGVYIDPVRNKFIIDIGIVACVGIIPLAFICGPIRNIPFYHQLIDCSFGILGMVPLFYVKRKINSLEKHAQESSMNRGNACGNDILKKQGMKKLFQKALDLFFRLHHKTSSFTAKLIGPTVFNYGTKEKNWKLSTAELLQFPEGSLGRSLGQFLEKSQVEPLAGAEYHDVQHVLLDYSITFKDEVALQFFLHGNGKRSIASVSTMIGAWCILPLHWGYLRTSYKRGKNSKDISALSSKALLGRDLKQLQKALMKEEPVQAKNQTGILKVNWQ